MRVCVYACMRLCVYAFMRVCVYACMRLCVYAFMRVCVYACMRLCVYMSLVKKYQHYYNKFIQNAFKISFTVLSFTNHESRGLQVFCRTHFNLVKHSIK
jgi:hypothetical protein